MSESTLKNRINLNKINLVLAGAGADAAKSALYSRGNYEADSSDKNSVFGTPIFSDLTFKDGSYLPLDGGEAISYKGLSLDGVLMSVSMSKNIITTAIQGKSGTVKEYVSDGDFEITVNGVISSTSNKYPESEVEALSTLFSVPDSLRVTSEFFSHFGVISPLGLSGIDEVVIVDFSFPQSEGFRNTQLFSCKMISDSPIELII